MSTTEQKEYIDKTYFDSVSGEEITVRKPICGRCKLPMRLDGTGHNECRKAFLMEEAEHAEKIRQQECILKFGRVISREEETWMTFPDSHMAGYRETYNQYLKRIAREKEEAHYKKLRDRTYRREQELPELERRLRTLKFMIERDEEEEAEEAKQKEQCVENVTKEPDQSLQTSMEQDEDTEAALQQYVKAKEQNN